MKPAAERGGVSRPSRIACTTTSRTPLRQASSAIATRWRSMAWTPPGPIEAHEVEAPSGLGRPPAGGPEHLVGGERRRRRWPRRCAAGPAAPAGRPPGCRWPTSLLPIWPAGSRPPRPRPPGGYAARPRTSARQAGILAAAMASASGRRPMPKPSSTSRTIGRGRPWSRGRATGLRGEGGAGDDAGHLVHLEARPADEGAVELGLGHERVDGGARDAPAVEHGHRVGGRPRPAPTRAGVARMTRAIAAASAPRAVRPVPMAHTGS